MRGPAGQARSARACTGAPAATSITYYIANNGCDVQGDAQHAQHAQLTQHALQLHQQQQRQQQLHQRQQRQQQSSSSAAATAASKQAAAATAGGDDKGPRDDERLNAQVRRTDERTTRVTDGSSGAARHTATTVLAESGHGRKAHQQHALCIAQMIFYAERFQL